MLIQRKICDRIDSELSWGVGVVKPHCIHS